MRIESLCFGFFLFFGYVSFSSLLQYIFYYQKRRATNPINSTNISTARDDLTKRKNPNDSPQPISPVPSSKLNQLADDQISSSASWKIQEKEMTNVGDHRWWLPLYMGLTNSDKFKPRGKNHSLFAR